MVWAGRLWLISPLHGVFHGTSLVSAATEAEPTGLQAGEL